MKRLSLILITAALSLALLTGCGGDKEPAADTKAETGSTAEKETEETTEEEPEAGTDSNGVAWNLTKEEAKEYPEGTVFLAPPLDADGNYPEDFDPESYDGVAGQIEEPDEKDGKEEKSEKKEEGKEKKESEKKENTKKAE